MIFGYSRISKEDQSNKLQLAAFDKAGVERVYQETASGGRWDRPALHEMLNGLRQGDIVTVWKLDRLSRSLKDLLTIMERIDKAGAGFHSITESVDTTTAAGRMLMQMIGAVAEFERSIIRERTQAGVMAAAAEGRYGGRPRKTTKKQERDIIDNVLSGRHTAADMARLYEISQATVSRIVAAGRLSR